MPLDASVEQLVVLPAKVWRDFTWNLIVTALQRPGSTLDSVKAEVQPVLDIEAMAEFSIAPTVK